MGCFKRISFYLSASVLLMPSLGISMEFDSEENLSNFIPVKHGYENSFKHRKILEYQDVFPNPGQVAGLYARQKGRKLVPPGFYASRQAKLNQLSRLEAHYLKQKEFLVPDLLGKFEEFFLKEKLKVGTICDRDWRNPLACSGSVDTAIRAIDTFLSALGR